MQHAELSSLAREAPLRVLLVHAGEPDSLTWSGLVQPLRLAAKLLGPDRLHVDVRSPDKFTADQRHWHLVLLVARGVDAGAWGTALSNVCRASSHRNWKLFPTASHHVCDSRSSLRSFAISRSCFGVPSATSTTSGLARTTACSTC